MNNIQGINGYGGPRAVGPQSQASSGEAVARPTPTTNADEVEISQIARFLSQIATMPEIRAEKVDIIRQGLATGTYDVEGKLSAALDKLLDEYTLE